MFPSHPPAIYAFDLEIITYVHTVFSRKRGVSFYTYVPREVSISSEPSWLPNMVASRVSHVLIMLPVVGSTWPFVHPFGVLSPCKYLEYLLVNCAERHNPTEAPRYQ